MDDLDYCLSSYFCSDYDARRAIQPLIERGVPLCVLAECIEEYARQTIAPFPHDLIHWQEVANYLLMEEFGAREVNEPVSEWSEEFDSNE